MARRKSVGPVERGDAPAGPAKLSAVDGASITPNITDRQPCPSARNVVGASLILIVIPDRARPGYFTARLAGDHRTLAPSRTPFFDAARTLLAAGFDPAAPFAMMHARSAIVSLSATIGTAARYMVEESAHGPVLRRFRMAPLSAVEAPPMRRPVPAGGERD